MRQTDIGSDHNLVISKVRLKLRRARSGPFDVAKLKEYSENSSTSPSETDTAYSKMRQSQQAMNETISYR